MFVTDGILERAFLTKKERDIYNSIKCLQRFFEGKQVTAKRY